MKITKIITVAALVVLFASCCSCRGTKNRNNAALAGTTWQLVQLEGNSFTAKDDSFTLTFNEMEKRITGRGDCNNISGMYNIPQDGKVSINGLVSTRAFCPDQSNEDRYVSLLDSADSYVIDGKTLIIYNNGRAVMMFNAK